MLDKKPIIIFTTSLPLCLIKYYITINCSGGQKRRTSLALALVHQPELLILDEPVSELIAPCELFMSVSFDSVLNLISRYTNDISRKTNVYLLLSMHVYTYYYVYHIFCFIHI